MKQVVIFLLITSFLAGCNGPDEITDSSGIIRSVTPISVLTAYPVRHRNEPTESGVTIIQELESITGVRCDVLSVDDIKTRDVALTPKEVIDVLVWALMPDKEREKHFGERVIANVDMTDVILIPRVDEMATWYIQGGSRSLIKKNIRQSVKLSPILEYAISLNANEELLSDIIRFAPQLYNSFQSSYWDALAVDGTLLAVPSRAPTREEVIWVVRKDILAETGLTEVRDYLDLARYWLRAEEKNPEYVVLADLARPWMISLQWMLERDLRSRLGIRFYDPNAEIDLLSCFYMTDNDGKLFSLLEHPRSDILDSIQTFSQTAVTGIFEPSGRFLARELTINLLGEFEKKNPRWYSLAIAIEPDLHSILDSERRDTYYRFIEQILASDEYTIFAPWENAPAPVIEPIRYPGFVFRYDTSRDKRISILTAMDRMFSSGSYDIYAYGIEGSDWKRTIGNTVESIAGSSSGSIMSDLYFPIIQLPFPGRYSRMRAVTPPTFNHYVKDYREYFGKYEIDLLFGFTLNEREITTELMIYRNEIVPLLNQYVTGAKSITEEWDTFTATYRHVVSIIRKEIQKQVDVFLLRS